MNDVQALLDLPIQGGQMSRTRRGGWHNRRKVAPSKVTRPTCATADAAGTVGHFRINQGAACGWQGTVTVTGGGGDLTLDNVVLALAQQVTITSMTLTAGGA